MIDIFSKLKGQECEGWVDRIEVGGQIFRSFSKGQRHKKDFFFSVDI